MANSAEKSDHMFHRPTLSQHIEDTLHALTNTKRCPLVIEKPSRGCVLASLSLWNTPTVRLSGKSSVTVPEFSSEDSKNWSKTLFA